MKRKIIPYRFYLVPLARKLRKNMTLSEVLLWRHLRKKQRQGYDFDRQRPIDRYIVDFYCKDLQLAIEIDGSSHNNPEAIKKDTLRQKRLEDLGVRFLRFDDRAIKANLYEVVEIIDDWIMENS